MALHFEEPIYLLIGWTFGELRSYSQILYLIQGLPIKDALLKKFSLRYDLIVTQDGTHIFSKVSPDEQKRLFKDLANVRGEITCKGDGDIIYRFIVERTTPRQELQCSVPFGMPLPRQEKEIFGNFFLGGERYFFRSPVKVEKDIIILRMDSELFHLQRRQNYRIKIPENYQTQLILTSVNRSPVNLSGQLYDLSCGGCRTVIANSPRDLKSGDFLQGQIIIGRREALDFEGTIRHYKAEKGPSLNKQVFGVEFIPLTSLLEGKLFAITMELHREFFSRLNTKT